MQGVKYAYAFPSTFTPKSNKSRILMDITTGDSSCEKMECGTWDGMPSYDKWYEIAATWRERFEKNNRFEVGQKVLYDLVEVEIVDKKVELFPDTQGLFPDRKIVRYTLKLGDCIRGDSGMSMTEVK